MRVFNTSGPCIPEKHYTLMREALVAQGQTLVDGGRFFTIFAPRQAGKTTYFQLLFGAQPVPFTINDPDIAYLYANGVVDNIDGYVQVPVPLYAKALITAFRPLTNGETQEYVSAHDSS